MQTTNKLKRIRLAITGPANSPKLYSALQIAYGLAGNWQRIIVLGSSPKDSLYQHLGNYCVLHVPPDATPQRYCDLLNLASGCKKDVIIYSSLTSEWQEGVSAYANTGFYEEALRGHRTLFEMIAASPVHIIALVDTKKKLCLGGAEGKGKIRFEQLPLQQEGFARYFTTVLSLDKKARAQVEKDSAKVLPSQSFVPSVQTGAFLEDWCTSESPLRFRQIQESINQCNSLAELYQLLFNLEIEDAEIIGAFTQRRLELEAGCEDKIREYEMEAELRAIQGGLHE